MPDNVISVHIHAPILDEKTFIQSVQKAVLDASWLQIYPRKPEAKEGE